MIIKLFEEFNSDLDNLKELLNSYNIPIDLWGTGKSKTINNLLNELENNECSLEEKNDKITRYIEFVGIKIYYNKDDERLTDIETDTNHALTQAIGGNTRSQDQRGT